MKNILGITFLLCSAFFVFSACHAADNDEEVPWIITYLDDDNLDYFRIGMRLRDVAASINFFYDDDGRWFPYVPVDQKPSDEVLEELEIGDVSSEGPRVELVVSADSDAYELICRCVGSRPIFISGPNGSIVKYRPPHKEYTYRVVATDEGPEVSSVRELKVRRIARFDWLDVRYDDDIVDAVLLRMELGV